LLRILRLAFVLTLNEVILVRAAQIEAWALQIVDRVRAGQQIEDSRVELKAEWPADPAKAARRIAGHANAARGDSVLWLIGVDEERGVTGAAGEDLAIWYPRVQEQFDGLAPDLIDLIVPVEAGLSIVALLFDTTRAPFVVKNPSFGKSGGGPVKLEVPWREGTSVRSASRSNLLRILVPRQRNPSIDVLSGSARMRVRELQGERRRVFYEWTMWITLYIIPATPDRLVIPFHKCQAEFWIPDFVPVTQKSGFKLEPPMSSGYDSIEPGVETRLSRTIDATRTEALIDGPGEIKVYISATTDAYSGSSANDLILNLSISPAAFDTPINVHIRMTRSDDHQEGYRWAVSE
jgi:hypothetical protein